MICGQELQGACEDRGDRTMEGVGEQGVEGERRDGGSSEIKKEPNTAASARKHETSGILRCLMKES